MKYGMTAATLVIFALIQTSIAEEETNRETYCLLVRNIR